jgi:DNA polymerase-3 subunit delta'
VTDIPAIDQLEPYSHPKQTERLIGQDHAETEFLQNFSAGRLHHAWLITGAKGVGKATFAYRAARFLLSGREGGLFGPPDTLDVDMTSATVSQITAGAHPGLAVLKRQYDQRGKKYFSVIRVDDVRALSSFFHLRSNQGSWRAVIIDSVDDMNPNAANAILKILEEPPERTVFFLLSHTPADLLPTIRSRCRILALKPLSEAHLRTVIAPYAADMDEQQMSMLLAIAEGSPGKALQMLGQGGLDIFNGIIQILGGYPRMDAEKLHGLADVAGRKDGEGIYRTICELYPWWLSRLVRTAGNNFEGDNLVSAEQAVMKRLIAAHPLNDWVDLWEAGNKLIAKADSVNLDRKQVVLNLFLNVERMGK